MQGLVIKDRRVVWRDKVLHCKAVMPPSVSHGPQHRIAASQSDLNVRIGSLPTSEGFYWENSNSEIPKDQQPGYLLPFATLI